MMEKKKKNVIAFMNMKGGVAKTTLSVNLAYTLAKEFNKKVLFIDMDPQFNATQYLFSKYSVRYFNQITSDKNFKTVIDIFKSENDTRPDIVGTKQEEEKPLILKLDSNLDIIPGDLELIKFDFGDRGNEQELLNLLIEPKIRDEYHYIIIDSAPTYSFYTLATYIASDYYLMPVKPDYFSLLGINLFEKAFSDKQRQYRIETNCLGIMFTVIEEHTNINKTIMEKFQKKQQQKKYLFQSFLRKRTSIPAGVVEKEMMLDNPETRENILDITREFIERIDSFNES